MSNVQRAVHTVWTSFFSAQRICNLADICICHLMIVSKDDVEEWAADPERFVLSEEHQTPEDNVSLAAEILFCSLAESSIARPFVLSRLVALLDDNESQMNACRQEVATKSITSDQSSNAVHPSVILWEAVYTAAGLSAGALDDFAGWDFHAWYRSALCPCLHLLLSNSGGVSFVCFAMFDA